MKKLIYLLLIFFISINSFAQPGNEDGPLPITQPPIKTRSTGIFTELDKFLSVNKILGIPTSNFDTFNCETITYKLLFNKTLNKLRIFDGNAWFDAVPLSTKETYLNSYWLSKLTPLNTQLTGYHIENNTNTLTGYTAFNNNDGGTAATSSFVAKGSGSDYVNYIAMSHFGGNYFVNQLRNSSAIYSDTEMFFINHGNKNIDFQTGTAYGSTTSKFKILNDGKLYIGTAPLIDNSLTTILGRDSSGFIKSLQLSSLPALSLPSFVDFGRNSSGGYYLGKTTLFTGGQGIRIGEGAGSNSTNSSDSVFIGSASGESSDGTLNVYLGTSAGSSATGYLNVFLGTNSGAGFNSITNITAIGANSARNSSGTNLSNVTFIGANSGKYNTYSNVINISAGQVPNYPTNNATNQLSFNTNNYSARFDLNLSQDLNFSFTNKSGQIPVIGTTAPDSATSTGSTGEIRITSTYVYVCIATNTWVRTALTTW